MTTGEVAGAAAKPALHLQGDGERRMVLQPRAHALESTRLRSSTAGEWMAPGSDDDGAGLDLGAVGQAHTDGAAAVEQHPVDQRVAADGQVRSARGPARGTTSFTDARRPAASRVSTAASAAGSAAQQRARRPRPARRSGTRVAAAAPMRSNHGATSAHAHPSAPRTRPTRRSRRARPAAPPSR